MAEQTHTPPSNTFLVEYECPAGGFSGSFLHTFCEPVSVVASTDPLVLLTDSSSKQRVYDAINGRLATMFGAGRAKWSMKLAQSVTPAVVDTDF